MLGLCRSSKGFREFFIQGAASDSRDTQVFLDRDKNRKTMFGEMLGRRLAKPLREKFGKSVYHQREKGEITFNRVPLAAIEVTGEDDFKIKWNIPLVAKESIDSAALVADLRSSLSPSDADVVWG